MTVPADLPTLLLLGLAVLLGAVVQSSVGFGLAVVAAPAVVVLAPELMPGALLVTTFSLPLLQLAAGPRDIAWSTLGWALAARLVLTPVGVLAVALLAPSAIAVGVGVLILAVVALSVRSIDLRPTRGNAVVAGAISGVTGTAASIGGPFLAMVLGREAPARVRATLAVFLVAGGTMAIAGLTLAGEFTTEQLVAGLLWLPFVGVGYVLAGPIRRHLDAELLRRWVLVVSTLAGVSVIVRSLVVG